MRFLFVQNSLLGVKQENEMKIKTFIGLTGCVDEWVNEFIKDVDVVDIQTHATGNGSMMATVTYKERSRGEWKILRLLPKRN